MSNCKNCESEATCLDEPVEDCKEFRETDEARRSRIEAEVKAHDERIRSNTIAEVKDIAAQCVSMSDADWNWFESEIEKLKEGNK